MVDVCEESLVSTSGGNSDPVEIAGQLLGDVRLASGREAHRHDQGGTVCHTYCGGNRIKTSIREQSLDKTEGSLQQVLVCQRRCYCYWPNFKKISND